MTNSLNTLTIAQLKRALALKERLAKLEKELASLLGTSKSTSAPGKKKGGMSAAGRAKVAAAQRARWAKLKAGNSAVAAKPAKKKFTMSASAKAAISKAAKARWAKIRAAKK